jgi:N-acetylmuramoyl-L-alanine amidase
VRLYSIGDDGEPVRDIQGRLNALGFSTEPDAPGSFGPGTADAVCGFQRARGLPADGIVGPDTWRALVGAGYRLGDRLLYRRVPMMRGDDVADLQRRLSALGFDTGKVDGIFGPDTLAGLLDFQSNRRLPEDGIAGREVADELDLMARATGKPGRDGVREHEWLAALPTHLIGQRVFVDPFCRTPAEGAKAWAAATLFSRIIQDLGANPTLSRSLDTSPAPRVRAVRANRLGVDFIVAFAEPGSDETAVYYFASAHSHSPAGKRLASAIADRLGIPVAGRILPILKDTRAPAVIVATEDLDGHTGGSAAQGVIDLFAAGEEAASA